VSMDAEHIARAQQALQERGEVRLADGRVLMLVSEEERKLLETTRELGHGELTVKVRDCLPQYAEHVIERIEFKSRG
jgi:hypothetical protein